MIHYRVGDATAPPERPAIIAHVCNDRGAWGAGFVLAVSKRWPEPEAEYRLNYRALSLGDVQYVVCGEKIIVANMVAQRLGGPRPLDDNALLACLTNVFKSCRRYDYLGWSVHMPRIGCGLAGGRWGEVEPIIRRALDGLGDLDVYVYDLAGA